MENLHISMVQSILDDGEKVRNMGMEYLLLMMVNVMKVIGRMV